MPNKVKFTPDRIIEAAFNIVRRQGWAPLSARSIAKELKSSTNPIYFHLNSMENIQSAVMKKGIDLCIYYTRMKKTGDRWIDQGVGYVMFARNEKHLFQSIIDENYQGLRVKHYPYFYRTLDEDLADYKLFQGLPISLQKKIRHARTVFTFGLASMASSSLNNELLQTEDQIIELVRIASFSLYQGLKDAHEPK